MWASRGWRRFAQLRWNRQSAEEETVQQTQAERLKSVSQRGSESPVAVFPQSKKQAYYVLMERLAAVAMLVVGLALPVCAQRAGTHSGSAGHSAPASHGGFSASSPRGFNGSFTSRQAGSPRSFAGRPLTTARGYGRGSAGNRGNRRDGGDRGRYRRPYISPYGFGYPGYGALGWIDPYPFDDSDSGDTDNSASSSYQNNEGAAGQSEGDEGSNEPVEQWRPAPRGPYPPGPYSSARDLSQPAASPESDEVVTLIFKDGRPPEQIHNYILTRSTLIVGDKQHRNIPTDQLDLIATAKANQDAGIEFRLPEVPQ